MSWIKSHPSRIPLSVAVAGLMAMAIVPAVSLAQPQDPAGAVVKNPASPANGLEVKHLQEMWRVGGEDSEVLFGHIFRAEGDSDQELAALLLVVAVDLLRGHGGGPAWVCGLDALL